MLMKTTDGVVTKYVYGRGLIGEETNGIFKTYHFDYRGSTVAITDINGNVTDRFEYDTYGKLTSRTGNSDVIFLYNGRDGVVTDANGLIYMRARYYSPELRRFINADILAGDIANAVTLNRYAYANGNPVSLIDPRGVAADSGRNGGLQTRPFVGSCTNAILVTDYSLPFVGHSELYFMDETGVWYWAEFNLRDCSNPLDALQNKGEAQIYWEAGATPPPYNPDFPTRYDYVELTGNFDESVKLAQYYAECTDKSFDGYNLFVNNCADYTDTLLEVADVDGMFSQIMVGEDDLISVPRVRKYKTSKAAELDSRIHQVSDGFKKAGAYVKDSGIVGSKPIGAALDAIGNAINTGANKLGDAIGGALVTINKGVSPLKNVVVNGAKRAWNQINPWD